MREVYAGRRALLLEFAGRYLRGMLTITGVEAGLQTAGWLPDGVDGETVARAAAEHDVEVTSLSRFASGPLTQEGLQLGFAAVDDAEIRRGVRDLAASLESLRRSNAKP
jgi:GntR family transcriptional regulator/MocR family aminotransferase